MDLTGLDSEFKILLIGAVVYSFNMISNALVYDVSKVVLIHLFMIITAKKLFYF